MSSFSCAPSKHPSAALRESDGDDDVDDDDVGGSGLSGDDDGRDGGSGRMAQDGTIPQLDLSTRAARLESRLKIIARCVEVHVRGAVGDPTRLELARRLIEQAQNILDGKTPIDGPEEAVDCVDLAAGRGGSGGGGGGIGAAGAGACVAIADVLGERMANALDRHGITSIQQLASMRDSEIESIQKSTSGYGTPFTKQTLVQLRVALKKHRWAMLMEPGALRAFRENRMLSVERLAEVACLPKKLIEDSESGRIEIPNGAAERLLAVIFGDGSTSKRARQRQRRIEREDEFRRELQQRREEG